MKRYDFGLTWSGNIKEKFVELLQSACEQRKLSFLWISKDNARSVARDLDQKKLAIKVLLDTEATYNKKGDKIRDKKGPPSIFITEVRKAPYITKPDSRTYCGK